jgi:predicted dehydrogenase
LEDCDAIVNAVEKAGIPFMGGHVLRYFPEYAAGKRLLDGGAVGKPAAVRTARVSRFPGQDRANNWYGDYKQSGGVILDLILHDFDWLRWCFGDVERVYAKGLETSEKYRGKLDYALVTLRFKSGVVGHVTGSWGHPSGFRTTYEVAGDAGIIDHDSTRSVPLTITQQPAEDGSGTKPSLLRSPMASVDDPYRSELRAFIRALDAGENPPVTVYDGREAVRIALAAVESVETGKVVTL